MPHEAWQSTHDYVTSAYSELSSTQRVDLLQAVTWPRLVGQLFRETSRDAFSVTVTRIAARVQQPFTSTTSALGGAS